MDNHHAKETGPSAPSATATEADYAAIIGVLKQLYDGLYYGDPALVPRTLHTDARYVTAAGPELLQLDVDAYLTVIAQRASPASRGEPYDGFDVEAIDLAGPVTACARVRSAMLGKRFIDFLVLIKVEGQWRIISKVFHYTTDQCHAVNQQGD